MSGQELTVGERRVLEKAPSGELVDLGDLSAEERVVSPGVIRRLCVGPEAKDVDPRGLSLRSARFLEALDLSHCTLPHPLGFKDSAFGVEPMLSNCRIPALRFDECSLPGLSAYMIRVEENLVLSSSVVRGAIKLRAATIGGDLNCRRSSFTRPNGIAISAEAAQIGGSVLLDERFRAIGTVRFAQARIRGDLGCRGARLTHDGRTALSVNRAEIGGAVFLDEEFTAIGAVQLLGVKIQGQLSCRNARFSNERASVLSAEFAEIGGGVFLDGSFTALGEVRLLGAQIAGNLECRGATFQNEHGYALFAEGANVNGNVFLGPVQSTGTVYFYGARIGGTLDCSHATIDRRGDIAIDARFAVLGRALVLRDAQISGGVDLSRASTTMLDDDLGAGSDGLGSWSGISPLVLDGFAYARIAEERHAGARARRRWLQQTSGYQHGAWHQLIEFYKAAGKSEDATSAAISMHNDRLRRAGLPRHRKAARLALWAVVGHGYRPWLAGLWAAAVIIAFALVVWHWSGLYIAEKPGVTGSPQPVAYAADTFLPIVDLGQADNWMPTGWIRWVEWSVILLGWSLSTIFVAGFTRIVRSE